MVKGKHYRGDYRREISFPLGGIGSGCIGLDGYGRLIDWEIFNRPNKRSVNGYSHFAVKAERNGRLLDARVLHADALPSYMGEGYMDVAEARRPSGSHWRSNYGFGPQRELLGGMPHFRDCEFEGAFPFATVRFSDEEFPGEVSLSAFNPYIPLDDKNSSLPAAFFTLTLTNPQDEPIDYTAALSLGNPQLGAHANRLFEEADAQGVCLTDNTPPDDPLFGQLVMAVDPRERPTCQQYWFRGSWFDDLSLYWREFAAPGEMKNRVFPENGDWKKRDTATLCVRVTLQPGETRAVRFVVAWYYPVCVNYWSPVREEETCEMRWRNYYASQFASAQEVAGYALRNWRELEARTRLFAETLYASDLPAVALDAVTANISLLKSPTCMRLTNGEFYAFEGCNMNTGSCEGSCTHVWNYAFALPFLFPSLERSMRELDYTYNQQDNGGMVFRIKLPLGRERGSFRSCVDGLMGGVIKFYREWKLCGDDEWLKKWWPKVKKSLEYAWEPTNADRWDPEKTGVITGRQHHTLDMELFGPNAWLNTFYLAALKAGAEIAAHLGETADAQEYERLYRQGREYTERELFNGEYFVQKVDLTDRRLMESFGSDAVASYWNEEAREIKYQIQDGCGIDQVLAQWMSDLCGLGDVLEPEKVASALSAIYRHNFKPVLRGHANPCRVYGLNDEAGTVICEWPEGVRKPVVPIPYAEETMHGFEYQAASHLIARGFEQEGLRMVQAVRDRYDGRRRNPWNEMECGSNYARSMASYALLVIYSGFVYDLPRRRMGFKPLKGQGRFFWSLEGAWGSVEVGPQQTRLEVLAGEVTLERFVLPGAKNVACVQANGAPVAFCAEGDEVAFDRPLTVRAGETLTMGV